MPLEKQVCSLELAKKLKELGVNQESLFYWVSESPNGLYSIEYSDGYSWYDFPGYSEYKYQVSAFTVAELGEILPTYTTSYRLTTKTTNENLFVCESVENGFVEDTEANARAKMLIYLIENNLIQL